MSDTAIMAGPAFDATGPHDLAARLAATAGRRPDHVAIRWQDRTITWAQLDARVTAATAAMQGLGVGAGDRVALVLGNVPAFVEAWFAVLRAGAVVVPLNQSLAPDELRHAMADAGASLVIADAAVVDRVASALHDLDDVPPIVVAGLGAATVDGSIPRWRDLVDASDPAMAVPVERVGSDLAAIIYTSGTTGVPRGAMLTHANLAANQDQSLLGRVRIEASDVVLIVLPMSHIFALNMGLGVATAVGATMVLQERFDPAGTLAEVERHGVTVLLGVPTMYAAWVALDTPAAALASVRVAISGAAPLAPRLFEAFATQHGIEIEEGYGLTEAGPSVASDAVADAPKPGSVGVPLPGVELRLVDDRGRDVAEGEPGEVLVRGPNVFAGYWRDEAATAEVLDGAGWLHTGDVGLVDDDGHLHLVDRRKDLILVSGFNVYPAEVERVLRSHEAVTACGVVGVPHPYTGEAVKAYVVLDDGMEISADELTVHCRQWLARYKCPESIEFVAQLPTTVTGKVRRGVLRADGA